MAWRMKGTIVEACTCDLVCPCVFGPAEPDQGWCSGAVVFSLQDATSDGVNLGGCKVAFAIDLPKDFATGGGVARIYVDESANANQRRELEAIFTGKKGGSFGALGGLIVRWLPTQYTKVAVETGEKPSVTVGNFGKLTLQRVKNEDGKQACLEGASILRAFGMDRAELARSNGSYMFDPDMRRWVAGGSGSCSPFSLTA